LAVLRFALLRGLAAVERFAVKRFAVGLLAAGLPREAAAPLDFARVVRAAEPAGFAREVVLRAAVLRLVVLRAAGLRAPLLAVDAALGAASLVPHLPDITRCAASATASAISEPSLVALAATLLAACCAVSAASSPASRILRRAAGLALMAAAAAARPAASISLLIAALVNLSTVELPDPDDRPDDAGEDVLEDVLLEEVLGDFAIAFSPYVAWDRHSSAVTVPK
jgi:hypothetical protein